MIVIGALIAGNHLSANLVGETEEYSMFNWALTFLIVALIAGLLGFTGVAGAASQIAWILFVVGLILAAVFFIRGRTPRI